MKDWFSKKNNNKSFSGIGSSLFVVGAVSCSVQLLLLKEVMNIAGGNELVVGIFMGSWLLNSALGSWLGGLSDYNEIRTINMVFVTGPVMSLFFLILCTTFMVHAGETMSFFESLLFTIIITGPVSIISGFVFIKLTGLAIMMNRSIPGKSFSIETLGSIFAGIGVSVISSGLINTYSLLLIIIIFSISFTILTFYLKSRKQKTIYGVSAILFILIILFSQPDVFIRDHLLRGSDIKSTTDTPYGNISYGDEDGNKFLLYNYRPLSYEDDIIGREEDIHFAMLQREDIEDVLLVSGPLASRLSELGKYPIKSVTYYERDPELIDALAENTPFVGFDLKIKSKDAYISLQEEELLYDAIIILIPPPSTLLLNRYYTVDFFKTAKQRLNDNGILLCSPGPGDNYLSQESVMLYSSIYNGLSGVFDNVRPVPGNKLYFLASDGPVSVMFSELSKERSIENLYVNKNYFIDVLTENRSNEIVGWLDKNTKLNTIANPIACFYNQKYVLSHTVNRNTIVLVVLTILFALPALIFRRDRLMMYFTASALSGFEIILLFMLQVTVGNMYRLTGIILASIMAGIAIGASFDFGKKMGTNMGSKIMWVALFYSIIGIMYDPIVNLVPSGAIVPMLIFFALLPSVLTGHMFRVLTCFNGKGPATSHVYSADLAGSAMGFVLISTIAVPLLGIQFSIFLISTFMLIAYLAGRSLLSG